MMSFPNRWFMKKPDGRLKSTDETALVTLWESGKPIHYNPMTGGIIKKVQSAFFLFRYVIVSGKMISSGERHEG